MAKLPRPGELPGVQPQSSDGREIIHIEVGAHNAELGFSRSLVAAGTAARTEDVHKLTLIGNTSVANSFADIEPVVFVDENARSGSEIEKHGLSSDSIERDRENGRLRTCGHFMLLRPSVLEGSVVIVSSLIAGTPKSKEKTWDEIEEELPRQVLITDEGITTSVGFPKTLAKRISLDPNEPMEIGLVVTEAEADDVDPERLNPVLWTPYVKHENGISVGTLKIDPLRLTANGLTDWTSIGLTAEGPSRSERLTAGLIFTTSGLAKQEAMPEKAEQEGAEVIQITDAHRAG